MKLKKALMVSLVSAMALSTVGCSGEKIKDVPVSEIQQQVVVQELLPQASTQMDAKDHWIFESVKDKIVEGFVSQANINIKLQDVFVVKTTDTEAVSKAIETYKEESLKLFSGGYGGEENATAVANSVLQVKGDYVYFIATPNVAEVEAKILDTIVK